MSAIKNWVLPYSDNFEDKIKAGEEGNTQGRIMGHSYHPEFLGYNWDINSGLGISIESLRIVPENTKELIWLEKAGYLKI